MIKEWGAQSPEWGPPNDQVIVKFCGTPLLCLLVKVFSFLETRTSYPEEPKISGTEGINFENVSLGVMVKRIDCASNPWFLEGHSTIGQPLIQHIYLILSQSGTVAEPSTGYSTVALSHLPLGNEICGRAPIVLPLSSKLSPWTKVTLRRMPCQWVRHSVSPELMPLVEALLAEKANSSCY